MEVPDSEMANISKCWEDLADSDDSVVDLNVSTDDEKKNAMISNQDDDKSCQQSGC
jgi:hypothetical protein